MNALRRALRVLPTSATSNERSVLHPTTFIVQSYATATIRRRKSKPTSDDSSIASKDVAVFEKPRPTEVPFQPKVANSVNLIGHVHMPLQLHTSPDGETWAATIIARQFSPPDSSPLWIPVIFEGDLAHVAACHLKEKDCIHIAGKLSADPPYLNEDQGQNTFQVKAQSLNFVHGYPLMKDISAVSKQGRISNSPATTKSHSDFYKTKETNSDLYQKKENNSDLYQEKENNSDLYQEKENNSDLYQKKESNSDLYQKKESNSDLYQKGKNNSDSLLSSWRDLLNDPKQWWDCRDSKRNKLVNPKYPDFKRKDGSLALWLSSVPSWVLPELKGLEFDALNVKSKPAKEHKGDDFWRDVVENPNKWWDNRSDKRNARYPDFKHKETGEGLWLESSPSWVLPKLPPLKPKQAETGKTQTPVKWAPKAQS